MMYTMCTRGEAEVFPLVSLDRTPDELIPQHDQDPV